MFNSVNHDKNLQQINEDYIKSLRDILEVNPEEYERLQAEVIKKEEYKLKLDNEIKSLEEEIAVSSYENTKWHIKNFFFIAITKWKRYFSG